MVQGLQMRPFPVTKMQNVVTLVYEGRKPLTKAGRE